MSWKSIRKFEGIDRILTYALFYHTFSSDSFKHFYENGEGITIEYDCKDDYFIIMDNKKEEIHQGDDLNVFTISQALLNFGIK
jgi:hypothetical protein